MLTTSGNLPNRRALKPTGNAFCNGVTIFAPIILTLALAVPMGVYGQQGGARGNSVVSRVAALEQRVVALEAALAALQNNTVLALNGFLILDLTTGLPIARFRGVNVQVVNGAGFTDTINEVGNLIVGYNETFIGIPPGSRIGSHNLIVGREHQFPSFGGVVAGFHNILSGQEASVIGGELNTASGFRSSVTGGRQNLASGARASVSGGEFNSATGDWASVTGGSVNQAGNDHASVSGGHENFAAGPDSSVSGGELNEARGGQSSVSGGQGQIAGSPNCWKGGTPADTC